MNRVTRIADPCSIWCHCTPENVSVSLRPKSVWMARGLVRFQLLVDKQLCCDFYTSLRCRSREKWCQAPTVWYAEKLAVFWMEYQRLLHTAQYTAYWIIKNKKKLYSATLNIRYIFDTWPLTREWEPPFILIFRFYVTF